MKIQFCPYCGTKLDKGARFCKSCGEAVACDTQESHSQTKLPAESPAERKTVYEGYVHKCPNCGKLLNAFDLVCPACGHEIRNREASTAVQRFAKEIAGLEAERDSPVILTHGRTEDGKPSKNARRKAREQIDHKIASYIQNFPIPNTKEDLFEFLILSSSNISEDRYSDKISKGEKTISDAWKSKFEQAYHKAKISFSNTPEFEKIDVIYKAKQKDEAQKKKDEERNKRKLKRQKIMESIFSIIGIVLMFAVMFAVLFFVISEDEKKTEAENIRLDGIVNEIYTCIENGDYALARAKTANLVFSGNSSAATEKWEKTRREMYAIIDRAEGIETGTVPDIQDVAGTISSEENTIEEFFSDVVNGLKSAFGF